MQVLLVKDTGSGVVGEVDTISLTFQRDRRSDEPLQVAVFEDTASGAGEVLRSSVWLAAVVAALHEGDDMAGVRISVDVSGSVDGPSAGGVICLALISILRDRDPPNDFAFTGSVLPDGTIGLVGGIAHKIVAAADDGIKRIFIPAFIRFQEDLNTGKLVDLKRLAESRGVELVAVENIEQAFRFAHRIKLDEATLARPRLADLPRKFDDFLINRTRESLASGDDLFSKLPNDVRQQLTTDPLSRSIFLDFKSSAEQALQAGRVYLASQEAANYLYIMQGLYDARKFIESIDPKISFIKKLAALKQETSRMLAGLYDLARRWRSSGRLCAWGDR